MLHPPNYSSYFILHIATSTSTIGMVLVQEDLNEKEHVIYYLIKTLLDSENRYSHVEKLSLATIIIVQRFRHYIFLRTTTVLAYQNPMYYFLTRQVLGESILVKLSSYKNLISISPRPLP